MPVFRVPAALEWSGPGSPGVNVWSIRTVEGSVIIDELDAALTELAEFYTNIVDMFAPGTVCTLGPDIANRETQEDESRPQKVVNLGSGTSDAPPSCQAMISWRTTLRARRGMGRTFIGPLSFSALSSTGVLLPGSQAVIQQAADALIAVSDTANNFAFGVWGLQDSWGDWQVPPPPDVPRVHRDFTSAKVNTKLGVLRSRRD